MGEAAQVNPCRTVSPIVPGLCDVCRKPLSAHESGAGIPMCPGIYAPTFRSTLNDQVAAASRSVEEARREGWQPIETAPTDRRAFMLWIAQSDMGAHVLAPISRDHGGGWWDDATGDQIEPIAGATHWRTLPDAPERDEA